MADLTDLTENSVGRPSRRKVLVGTAWAVPVVMGVGATPAMAASTIASVAADTSGKVVTFTITVTDWRSGDVLTPGTVTPSLTWATPPASSYDTPTSTLGTTATFTFTATGQTGSNGKSYTLPFTVSKTGGGTLIGTVLFTY